MASHARAPEIRPRSREASPLLHEEEDVASRRNLTRVRWNLSDGLCPQPRFGRRFPSLEMPARLRVKALPVARADTARKLTQWYQTRPISFPPLSPALLSGGALEPSNRGT